MKYVIYKIIIYFYIILHNCIVKNNMVMTVIINFNKNKNLTN